MKKTVIILSVFALIASSCTNKKVSFDYSTLPAEWTALIPTDIDNEFAVCDEVGHIVTIKGNILTQWYLIAGEKWEHKILESYQTDDTIILNVKPTIGREVKYNFKIVWLDKERGIFEFIDEYYFKIDRFVSNEKLSEFPKARCSHDDYGRRLFYVENKSKNPDDLLRLGDRIFEKIFGDLNNDGKEDCVIITKQTKESAFVENRFDEIVDRNRRGIVIAFKEGEYYNTVLVNSDCFSSENEDGGIYFAPELFVEIQRGNLKIHYGHGRYGWWQYTFSYRNNDFELIEYDEVEMFGPILCKNISVNFLTKKQQIRTNTNFLAEDESEKVIEEIWQNIVINNLVKLTDISDFDDFSVSNFYTENENKKE